MAVVLLVLARDVALGALGLLTWMALAALIAISLNPVIEALQRPLRVGRGIAVAIIGLAVLALVVFVVTYLGPRAVRQADRFPTELPGVTKRLTDLPIIGHRLAAADVPQRLNDWIEQLPRTLGNDSQPLVNALDAVVNGVLLAVAALVMVVAFLLDGPEILERLGRGLRRREPRPVSIGRFRWPSG